MTTQQISHRLLTVLANSGIHRTTLTDQVNFSGDSGLDSLAVTDLLIQVESGFAIRIPDEDWHKLRTVGQLKAYLFTELEFETYTMNRVDTEAVNTEEVDTIRPDHVSSSPFLALLWGPTCPIF